MDLINDSSSFLMKFWTKEIPKSDKSCFDCWVLIERQKIWAHPWMTLSCRLRSPLKCCFSLICDWLHLTSSMREVKVIIRPFRAFPFFLLYVEFCDHHYLLCDFAFRAIRKFHSGSNSKKKKNDEDELNCAKPLLLCLWLCVKKSFIHTNAGPGEASE